MSEVAPEIGDRGLTESQTTRNIASKDLFAVLMIFIGAVLLVTGTGFMWGWAASVFTLGLVVLGFGIVTGMSLSENES